MFAKSDRVDAEITNQVRHDQRQYPGMNAEQDASQLSDVSAGVARPLTQSGLALAEFDQEIDSASSRLDEVSEVLLKHANVLYAAKEYRLALTLLRNLLMRKPNSPEAILKMGLCFREEARYEEALKCFRALLKVESEFRRLAQVHVAEILYLSERDQLALSAYREILKQPIENPTLLFDIYKNVGNIHVRSGDFEAAEEFYDKAYVLNPSSDVLMVNYGTLEIQRECLEAAVQRFRRAVEINSNSDKGWVGLALVHRQMGDHELAWANVQRSLDINKKNRTAIRLLVEWAVADQLFDESILRLQRYLEVDGEDAEMSFTLAKILTHVGRLVEARVEIERVLALDPAAEGASQLKLALDTEIFRGIGSEKV